MGIRFFTYGSVCFFPGYCATEGLKFEANGSFYVQRAEKTRLRRWFPLAVAVYRLVRHLLSPVTRFTVQPARRDCSTQNYLLWRFYWRTALRESVLC